MDDERHQTTMAWPKYFILLSYFAASSLARLHNIKKKMSQVSTGAGRFYHVKENLQPVTVHTVVCCLIILSLELHDEYLFF